MDAFSRHQRVLGDWAWTHAVSSQQDGRGEGSKFSVPSLFPSCLRHPCTPIVPFTMTVRPPTLAVPMPTFGRQTLTRSPRRRILLTVLARLEFVRQASV